MKYTKEERLEIGRQIYDGEITRYQAAEKDDISEQTARSYMRMYRDVNQLLQDTMHVTLIRCLSTVKKDTR